MRSMLPRTALIALAAALAACAPVDDPNDTVTLEPVLPEARAERDRALQTSPRAPAASPITRLDPGDTSAVSRVGGSGSAVTQVSGTAPAAAAPGALADTNTLSPTPAPGAVAATPAAESYEVVAARPVPPRPGSSSTGVVEYALATSHAPGTALYTRSTADTDRAARACARYSSADLAQAAFLNNGGPTSDPRGLDPDGDGFACAWDPAPFRRAVQ